jgi:phosphoglycolate phosphatase
MSKHYRDKRLVIFDMDGTLVDSSLTIVNAINHVRKHLGLAPLQAEYVLSKVNDHTINPAYVFYEADAFTKEHERLFSEYYSANHDKELILYDGIKELLAELKTAGKLLAVATNAYRRSTLESLNHLGIARYFDAVACYDDADYKGKPDPTMLLMILDALDVDRSDAVFVGDGERDALAAKRAGIDYIMVAWGFSDHGEAVTSVEELEELLL